MRSAIRLLAAGTVLLVGCVQPARSTADRTNPGYELGSVDLSRGAYELPGDQSVKYGRGTCLSSGPRAP